MSIFDVTSCLISLSSSREICLIRFYFGIQSTYKYDAIWSYSWNVHYESKKRNTKQEQYHTVQHVKHFIRIIYHSCYWKISFGYNYSLDWKKNTVQMPAMYCPSST